jgi:hypothetical protein
MEVVVLTGAPSSTAADFPERHQPGLFGSRQAASVGSGAVRSHLRSADHRSASTQNGSDTNARLSRSSSPGSRSVSVDGRIRLRKVL